MDVLMLLSPLLAAGLLSLPAVKKGKEMPNAKPGRLWLMLLLLLPLTVGVTYGYYLGAFFLSFVAESYFGNPWRTVFLVFCMVIIAYIALLLGRLLAHLLQLTKKNRLISAAVMTLLLMAETYAFYVYISGSYI